MDGEETTYTVGKNDAGEIIGIVQNPLGRRVMTETETSLDLVSRYRDRRRHRLAGEWFFVQCDTKIINDTRNLLTNLQAAKRKSGVPLDMPEVT